MGGCSRGGIDNAFTIFPEHYHHGESIDLFNVLGDIQINSDSALSGLTDGEPQ